MISMTSRVMEYSTRKLSIDAAMTTMTNTSGSLEELFFTTNSHDWSV
jgi:hypothetical protein